MPKVYVIDDDPEVLRSIRFLLSAAGHDCLPFDRPKPFLEALATLEPGCVITDLQMAETNGLQLHGELVRRGVNWPVILISGADSRIRGRAALRGFAAILPKPVASGELLAVVERCLAGLAGDDPGQENPGTTKPLPGPQG